MQVQSSKGLFNKLGQQDFVVHKFHNPSKVENSINSEANKYQNEIVTSSIVSIYYNLVSPNASKALSENNNIKHSNATKVLNPAIKTQSPEFNNNLKTLFEDNKAVIYALIPRTFNAKDENGNELIEANEQGGTFLNAIERLDELKSYGINTLHILPCYKPNVSQAMGTAGSIYSVADFLALDPKLDDKNDGRNVEQEFKQFTDECHKRGIGVMIDIPGCAGIDLYNERPDLMSKNSDGTPKIPQGWQDIRMFEPWKDKDKKELNTALVDYFKDYVGKYLDLGVDGFRVDVARSKPTEFWTEIIPYARNINPECAFLAESYTYEDASPMANISADRPEDLLKAGFDSYYGQYHIFNEWNSSEQFHENMILNLEMTKNLPDKKSLIGSFATHDDKSPMANGGVDYCNMTTGLQETLPMTNPYFVTGFESGDEYKYAYGNKEALQALKETDCNKYTVHPEKLDIFNQSAKPQGKNPEIGKFMGEMANIRAKYQDVITKGSYIPLTTTNKQDKIIAYARHLNGKTILVVANKDVNHYQSGRIKIDGLKCTQSMENISPENGNKSTAEARKDEAFVELSPAKFMMFEIDTPDIEKSGLKVYKQSNI